MRINKRQLDSLQVLIRRKLNNLEHGLYKGFYGAEGFEIRDVRPYESGDSPSRIHWYNTAREGKLMVWEAEPEIALSMGVVIDLSASMFFGTDDCQKVDVASGVLAAAAYVGSRNGNQVGSLMATESVIPHHLGQGDRHVAKLLGLLSQSDTEDGTTPTFVSALNQYNRRFKRRGLAIVVSDFLTPGWEDAIRRISQKHTILCVRVIDRRELTLENVGVIMVEHPVSGEIVPVDTSDSELRKEYADRAEIQREKIKQTILGSGAEYFELNTKDDWLEDFIHQLNRRNQRLQRGRRVA